VRLHEKGLHECNAHLCISRATAPWANITRFNFHGVMPLARMILLLSVDFSRKRIVVIAGALNLDV
jgi:hypothetical protein